FSSFQGRFTPKNDMYDPNGIQHFNAQDNTVWYQGDDQQIDRRHTFQGDFATSLRGRAAGTHEAKIGIQNRYIYHTIDYERPGGTFYTDRGNGAGEPGLCNADPTLTNAVPMADPNYGKGCFQRTDIQPYSNHQWGYSFGFFVQDKWKPHKRITIMP